MKQFIAFGAHPDDVEVGCGGLLSIENKKGNTIQIVDMTLGENGNGGKGIRFIESEKAAKFLGCEKRIRFDMKDSYMKLNDENIEEVKNLLLDLNADVVLLPYPKDIHRDHKVTTEIIEEAIYLAKFEGYRPKLILYYLIDTYFEPDIVVDISDVWELKKKSLLIQKSQYKKENMDMFLNEPMARLLGSRVKTKYAEGFIIKKPIIVSEIDALRSAFYFD